MSARQAEQTRKAVPVTVKDLCKSYGEQQVLKNISFEVEAGEVFVLMGPSGSGKSVLMRQIIGLETADSGQVQIDGLDASKRETHKKVVTSIVFQSGALFNSMSVFDNLALYPREHRLYSASKIKEKVEQTLEILNLNNAAKKTPAELSGGMKKRVAIARALMMEPQLILYDEPTSELDPISAANISEVIATLKDQFDVTSIVVSHDRDLARSISARVGILFDGKLEGLGTWSELEQNDNAKVSEFLDPAIDLENPRFKQ